MFRSAISILFIATCLVSANSDSNAAPVGEKHIYKNVGDRELVLYVTSPEEKSDSPRPAIVFFHGGGWTGGAPGQFTEHSKYFATRGIVCVQVQYRLLNKKKDKDPTNCVQDAKSAMRWVRSHASELGIDPKRIAAGGGSAGGHLAAFVGMVEGLDAADDDHSVSPKANALLLFNPVFDNGPDGWGHQWVKARYKEFSPFHNISADDPPAIVFLGDMDKLIPVETLHAFEKKMQADGVKCETIIFAGMGHGFFNHGKHDNKPYTETVIACDKFLNELGWISGPPTLK
ncbi:MAG: alpha/beta hydrolase [Planctomycetaceae bacterium]|jgi:acetyl esterase|nr:alpha/beta hydrolase [Planctomycetaceae bacterium]